MIATTSRPNQGLGQEQADNVVRTFNHLLADEFVLYTKTLNYHWNVIGPQFHSLHLFFEDQYEQLQAIIDKAAEAARSYGGRALGTMGEFAKEACLREQQGEVPQAERMVENLMNDHDTVIRQLREVIPRCNDEWNAPGAADILTSVMEDHQKMAWMLRSTAERQ